MRLLSEAAEYALRATVWMAKQPPQPHKVREIAAAIHAAPGYLVKVLQQLAKNGILSAQRGSNGGFSLQRDPADLSVLDVLNAVDPIERIHSCPLGVAEHAHDLCPMHRRIDDAVAAVQRSFAQSSIREIIDEPVKRRRPRPEAAVAQSKPGRATRAARLSPSDSRSRDRRPARTGLDRA